MPSNRSWFRDGHIVIRNVSSTEHFTTAAHAVRQTTGKDDYSQQTAQHKHRELHAGHSLRPKSDIPGSDGRSDALHFCTVIQGGAGPNPGKAKSRGEHSLFTVHCRHCRGGCNPKVFRERLVPFQNSAPLFIHLEMAKMQNRFSNLAHKLIRRSHSTPKKCMQVARI